MKKILLGLFFSVGLSASVLAQATILIDNTRNTGVFNGFGGTPFDPVTDTGNPVYSSNVTSNGLFFAPLPPDNWGSQGGPAGSQLLGVDISFILYGGPTAAIAAAETNVVFSLTGSSAAGDNLNWGQISVPGTKTVQGTTADAPVYLDLQAWLGTNYSNAGQAQASGHVVVSTGAFLNPSGGGPTPGPTLVGMPDVIFEVPEPSVLALSGIGAAAFFLVRRRK